MIQRLLFVLALAACLGCHSSLAQVTRTVDGRRFTEHTVLAGQTLYAISRHYAVPIDALLAANPSARQGLSLGQVLLIPQDAVVKKEKKYAPALVEGELAHTVRKKETLFGIARQYGVDQNDLLQRNPELNNGFREGMVVIIPVARIVSAGPTAVAPAVDDGSRAHLVLPGETLFSLARQYGVTQEEIQQANGGLPQGLKTGTYLRIPAVAGPVEVPVAIDTVVRRERYKVAFLLPFSIARNDSLHAADPAMRGYDELTGIAVDFYAGARMALDSLMALGLNADVQVFDVGGDARVWGPVLAKSALRDMDLYIGPFHRGAIDQLARVAQGGHIVCPVPQSNKVLLGHPNVSKVIGVRLDHVQQLARHAALRHAMDNIVLLRPELPAEKEVQEQMQAALINALATQPSRLRDTVLVAVPTKKDLGDLPTKLDAAKDNVIIVPSEDVEFVTSVVGRLAAFAPKYRIHVYGLNNWMNMETLSPFELDKLDVHLPVNTYVDRGSPAVRSFIEDFTDRYHSDPSDYAFLGFDVTYYYLTALLELGRDFAGHYALVYTRPLHMNFRMVQAGMENGYRNESTTILHLQDLQWHRAP